MTKLTEKSAVQDPLIRYAEHVGWTRVASADAVALRKGEGGLLFGRVLEERLISLNPGLVTKDNVAEAIQRIESAPNTIEGNAEILAWLRNEQSLYDHTENRERNVTVIDYDHPDNNVFQVTEEWQYTNGRETHRADIMFLINGIPVALVETKSARKQDAMQDALVQIREYHHETPEMLTAPQVFNITHLIDFYYSATWNLERKNLFNWRPPSPEGSGVASEKMPGRFEDRVKSFFDRERFLTMLKEWILFFYKDDELRKSILRRHQTRAVERILDRCADEKRSTGLIWHTQGSGKTFTMITAARLLLTRRDATAQGGKPTVILMIDRNELEGQLSGWVERVLGEMSSHDISIEQASSKRKLRTLLSSDFRGLIISMIHKFDHIPKDINTRENIYVLVDEAHRTTGGDLGNYLLAALPNATLIGFTGTPIDRTAYGKGTFKVFGKEDDQGYLDKYSIAESIADGTTVPLRYTLAPNEIRVPQEELEKEFLDLAKAEGVSDVEELNKILDHAMRLKTFLKSGQRIDDVARFTAEHFAENVEPMGYKAFLVAVDREACALYKEALDKYLPPEYSLPIYTSAQHDSEKYPGVYKHQIAPDAEKKARKLFPKPNTLPKIFIVTDKLLTGFDAPILYCMYLDKPMRDHVLLQVIARVNRPYEKDEKTRKPSGLVVDFVGIFEKLEKALAFDSDVVSGVIEDLELLFVKFKAMMAGPAREYIDLCKGPIDDKAVERAMDALSDSEKRETFNALYKQIESLYEILSPSPGLRDYIDDFGCLSVLYRMVQNAFKKKPLFYGDVAGKTERLVREKVESFGLEKTLNPVTLDEETLNAIKRKSGSDNAKIINLVNSVRNAVDAAGEKDPYLIPIGDRAESILERYVDRQESTEEALRKMEALIGEILEARREKEAMGFDDATFSFFWTLKQEKADQPEKIAGMIRSIFERFPHHRDNAGEMRQLKAELYKILLPIAGKDKMVALAEKLMRADAS